MKSPSDFAPSPSSVQWHSGLHAAVFSPFHPKLLCCWVFIHVKEGQLHLNVCARWKMKCEEHMDGVELRLGSKRRYLAALSNHLQDSKIKPSSGAWGSLDSCVWPVPASPVQWECPDAVGKAAKQLPLCPWAVQDPWRGKEQAKELLKVEQQNQTIVLEKKKKDSISSSQSIIFLWK